MKSKGRRQVERWIAKGVRDPVYLAEGRVFLVPGLTHTHHLVTWMHRQTPKRVFEEWACSCPGWFYSLDDTCVHIKEIQRQVKEASA